MNIIQERILKIDNLITEVKKHPMCFDFEEVDKSYYLVTYPEGFQLDGVRISLEIGKSKALSNLLDIMESHWYESYPS